MRSLSTDKSAGISTVIGAVILVVLVIILSVGVLFTAQTLLGGQPQDMTAGTTDERTGFYTHEAQLVNQGNTDTVYAVSPLGTEYELNDAGDLQKILPLEKGSHYGVDQYQIVGEREGQEQLLKTQHFEEGVDPDVVVHDDGDKDYKTIQEAINNIDADTDHEITSNKPGVIVVQKGVYNENIEVSNNISLIAEYGTVIQDENPNEDVIDVRGDNVRVQNFEVDGNPDPEDEDHYARHGINVQGSDAKIQGNTVYNAESSLEKSAGVNIDGRAAIVRYNNIYDSESSLRFGQEGVSPVICGNQFENGIGGYADTDTQSQVAQLNHWSEGVPSNIAKTILAERMEEEQNDSEEQEEETEIPTRVQEQISETNSRVDPTILGNDAGRAGLPFTGTKLASSQSDSLSECGITVGVLNDPETGNSIEISEIEVTINERKTTIEVVNEQDLGSVEDSDSRDVPIATCECGGDDTYDPGDRINIEEEEINKIQVIEEDATAEPFMSGDGGSPTPSSFSVDGTSTPPPPPEPPEPPDPEEPEDQKEPDEGSDSEDVDQFRILLGSSVDVNLADEVVLTPVVAGAEGDVEYDWDLGDGTTSTKEEVKHLYEDPGTYQVTLTVTDTATGETDTDSTKVTVDEGTKDLEKIREDEQQRLSDLVEEDPDGDGKIIYLEEDVTYTSLETISARDLTIVGQGEDVTLDGPITVTSSGVTMKNVAITDGLIVKNNDFTLYNSKVTNDIGDAVSVSANGQTVHIEDSNIEGHNGVSIDVDGDVTLKDNDITASNSYAVQLGPRMLSSVKVKDNTLTAGEYGIYREHATYMETARNTINAPTKIERIKNQAPIAENLGVETDIVGTPTMLTIDAYDPDGDQLKRVIWDVEGHEAVVKEPGQSLKTEWLNTGENDVTIIVEDVYGASEEYEFTVDAGEFNTSISGTDTVAVGSSAEVAVDYNIPSHRIYAFYYEWDDGSERQPSASSSETHVFEETGTYDVEVTTETDTGLESTDTYTVEVVDEPVPSVTRQNSDTDISTGESVTFDAGDSSSPTGDITKYEWDFDNDGHTDATGQQASTSWDTIGEQTFTVTVTDENGITGDRTFSYDVTKYDLNYDGDDIAFENSDVAISADPSIDDQMIESYKIDFGDGETTTTSDHSGVTHQYSETGEYTITIETETVHGYTETTEHTLEIVDSEMEGETLQDAIDAAEPGEELLVPPGIYGSATVNKDLTLIGSGDSTTIEGRLDIRSNNVHVENVRTTNDVYAYETSTFKNVNFDNGNGWGLRTYDNGITVKDSEFNGHHGAFVNQDNNKFQDSTFDVNGYGIRVDRYDGGHTFDNLDITSGNDGFYGEYRSSGTITDTTVDSGAQAFDTRSRWNLGDGNKVINGGGAIEAFTYSIAHEDTVELRPNSIVNTDTGKTLEISGDYYDSQNRVYIRGGTITSDIDFSGTEFRLYGSNSGLKDMDISNGGRAVYISANDVTIDNSVIKSSNSQGVFVSQDRTTIKDTTINAGSYGIRVDRYDGGHTFDNLDITSGNDGIYGEYRSSGTITDTTVDAGAQAFDIRNRWTLGGGNEIISGGGAIEAFTYGVANGETVELRQGEIVNTDTGERLKVSEDYYDSLNRVYVRGGTITSDIDFSGTEFRLYGSNSGLKDMDITNNGRAVYISANDVTIENSVIKSHNNQGVFVSQDRTTIKDTTINAGSHGIRVDRYDGGHTFDNLDITSGNDGIYGEYRSSGTITDITVDAGAQAFDVGNRWTLGGGNEIISGSGAVEAFTYGVANDETVELRPGEIVNTDTGERLKVSNDYFDNLNNIYVRGGTITSDISFSGTEFRLYGSNTGLKDMHITNGGRAVYISANDVTIEDSVIKSSNGKGVFVRQDRTTIRNTEIVSGSYGIHVDRYDGGHTFDNLDITSGNDGIYGEYRSGATVTDTTVDSDSQAFDVGNRWTLGGGNEIISGGGAVEAFTYGVANDETVELRQGEIVNTDTGERLKVSNDYFDNLNNIYVRGGTITSDIQFTGTEFRLYGSNTGLQGMNIHNDGGRAVYVSGNGASIVNSELAGSKGVYIRTNGITIRDTSITANGYGVHVDRYDDNQVIDNVDITSGNDGIYAEYQSSGTITDTTIDSGAQAFDIQNGWTIGSGNEVTGGSGAVEAFTYGVANSETIDLRDGSIVNTDTGETLSVPSGYFDRQGSIYVRGGTITSDIQFTGTEFRLYGSNTGLKGMNIDNGNDRAVYVSGRHATISDSVIKGSKGVYIRTNDVTVKNTEITANGYGIHVDRYDDNQLFDTVTIDSGNDGIYTEYQSSGTIRDVTITSGNEPLDLRGGWSQEGDNTLETK